MICSSEPVQLIGEGIYNLNELKQINVTKSFLGMNQNKRGCQNEESLGSCRTRWYRNTMLDKCGCLPFSIRTSNQVACFLWILWYVKSFQDPLCTSEGIQCVEEIVVENLRVDNSNCLPPCTGLILTSYSKSTVNNNWEDKILKLVYSYLEYTKWEYLPTELKGNTV